MIERFNFYDVYGYLIPGFVWLALIAIPFHFIFQFQAFSAGELTASLVAGYVAGHVLGGLARLVLPSSRYEVKGEDGQPIKDKKGKAKQFKMSEALLYAAFDSEHALPPKVRKDVGTAFAGRFGYNPLDPFDAQEAKQMFYLCRTALSQAKLGSYVEQYQGMTTLTKNIAFGTFLAAVYYAAWVGASVARRNMPERSIVEHLPLVTLAVAIALALSAGGLVAVFHRLKSASISFDRSFAQSVYRDFVVLCAQGPDKKYDADPWSIKVKP